jgi:hypothetical protein
MFKAFNPSRAATCWGVVFLILLIAPRCLAWGGMGHQIVALIAEDRLSDQAVAGVRDLLGDDQISDAVIASWADEIRRERRDTAPWHYVNIPFEAEQFDQKRDGNDGRNVIDAITGAELSLTDASASRSQKIEALKFIVHLVGDIHQPLHCAERNHDRGGNGRLVFFLDRQRAVNLHSVWDTLILQQAMGKQRVADYSAELEKEISSKQASEWEKGTPKDWANESHRVAVESAYAGVPADGSPPKLDATYVEQNKKVVRLQLERAGVRLAMILNRAFAKKAR